MSISARLTTLNIDAYMFAQLKEHGYDITLLEALAQLLQEKLRTTSDKMNTFFDAQNPGKLTIFGKVTLGNILCQEKATILQG